MSDTPKGITLVKYVLYYRVSTQQQGRSGLGLEAQRAAVEAFMDANGPRTVIASFTEVESGKNNDRPQLMAAIKRCKQTRATLLVAKLDRLGRNAAFLFTLRDSGVKFVAADMPEANTLMLGIMISMAQYERELISTRTKAALAAAKARGVKLGGPDLPAGTKRTAARARAANEAKAQAHAEELREVINAARAAGKESLREIAQHLTELAIPSRRGCAWTPSAVSRLLGRLAPKRSK
jgi:DNA invertase Pin-like site-specific DNA recombinase